MGCMYEETATLDTVQLAKELVYRGVSPEYVRNLMHQVENQPIRDGVKYA